MTIDEKLDKLLEKVHDNHVQQAEIKQKLEDHIEQHKETKDKVDEIEQEVESINQHVATVRFVAKFVLAPIITTILIGITKVFFF